MGFLISKEYWLGLTIFNGVVGATSGYLFSTLLAVACGSYTLYVYTKEEK